MTSKRTVLRTGFGIVIGVSVVSTVLAFRMQETFSQRTVSIHRRYVQQQTVLNNLRRLLWAGGILARDFFLNPAPNRAEVYMNELEKLRTDSELYFRQLNLTGDDSKETSAKLKTGVDELLEKLIATAQTPMPDDAEYSFVQQQVVPRREAAARLLRELEHTNETALTRSEEEFAATRRASAQGLAAILVVGLLLAVVVTRFSLRYAENLENQTAAQLEAVSEAKAELERLSARLMEIQEEERTRLSRELHDEIVQTLALLRIEATQAQQLPGAQAGPIREHLERMRGLAERTLQTVRNISLLLRPSLLDDLGLGPALQWLTEDFRRRTKVRCDFEEEHVPDDLPEAVKTCVYRVTQEALHNCEKHARAQHVSVRVLLDHNILKLQVADDGVGLTETRGASSAKRGRLGILGMRERAASLGGSLTLEPAESGGLKVTLTVPLSRTLPLDAGSRAEALA